MKRLATRRSETSLTKGGEMTNNCEFHVTCELVTVDIIIIR